MRFYAIVGFFLKSHSFAAFACTISETGEAVLHSVDVVKSHRQLVRKVFVICMKVVVHC